MRIQTSASVSGPIDAVFMESILPLNPAALKRMAQRHDLALGSRTSERVVVPKSSNCGDLVVVRAKPWPDRLGFHAVPV